MSVVRPRAGDVNLLLFSAGFPLASPWCLPLLRLVKVLVLEIHPVRSSLEKSFDLVWDLLALELRHGGEW